MPEHIQYQDDELFNPETHHEESDVPIKPLFWAIGIFIVFAIVTHLVLAWMYEGFRKGEEKRMDPPYTQVALPRDAYVPKNQPLLQPFPREGHAPREDTPVTDSFRCARAKKRSCIRTAGSISKKASCTSRSKTRSRSCSSAASPRPPHHRRPRHPVERRPLRAPALARNRRPKRPPLHTEARNDRNARALRAHHVGDTARPPGPGLDPAEAQHADSARSDVPRRDGKDRPAAPVLRQEAGRARLRLLPLPDALPDRPRWDDRGADESEIRHRKRVRRHHRQHRSARQSRRRRADEREVHQALRPPRLRARLALPHRERDPDQAARRRRRLPVRV